MSNLKTDPVSLRDMREYLETQDDLRLEVGALKLLTGSGWKVRHGGFYEDPVTKKVRQFDLRAQMEFKDMRVSLAVECKALKPSFPLLVSRLPRVEDEAFHEVLYAHEPVGQGEFSMPATDEIAREIRIEYAGYDTGKPVGKHTIQVGRKQNDELLTGDAETFDKWSQALASASDLINDNATECAASDGDYRLSVTLPVLVVADGTLWAVDYDSHGEEIEEPRTIESAEYFVGRKYGSVMPHFDYEISHLHLVTLGGFATLVHSFDSGSDGWARWFPKNQLAAMTQLHRP